MRNMIGMMWRISIELVGRKRFQQSEFSILFYYLYLFQRLTVRYVCDMYLYGYVFGGRV